jgi:hypothetical protein
MSVLNMAMHNFMLGRMGNERRLREANDAMQKHDFRTEVGREARSRASTITTEVARTTSTTTKAAAIASAVVTARRPGG